jgi:hypothetical protein
MLPKRFSKEEKTDATIVAVDELEKDKNLSMAEKAHRAQQLLQSKKNLQPYTIQTANEQGY